MPFRRTMPQASKQRLNAGLFRRAYTTPASRDLHRAGLSLMPRPNRAALVVVMAWMALALGAPAQAQTDVEAPQEPQTKSKKRKKKAKPTVAEAPPAATPATNPTSGTNPPPITKAA